MSDHNELKKQAQEKLAGAWCLIKEAGELAKQGQFSLHFGEVGDFVPRSFTDPRLLRELAIENLKANGWTQPSRLVQDPSERWGYRYEKVPSIPWDDLNPNDQLRAIDDEIERIREDIPSEVREYGLEVADEWWAPSRC